MAVYNYDPETALESALVSLLQAEGLTAGGLLTSVPLSTPRVDVQFVLGQERDVGTPVPGQEGINCIWEGSFVLTIYTDRDRNNASHSTYRATVRQVIAESTRAQWEAVIGANFRLLSLTHAGTSPTVRDSERAIDASEMTYSAVVMFVSNT